MDLAISKNHRSMAIAATMHLNSYLWCNRVCDVRHRSPGTCTAHSFNHWYELHASKELVCVCVFFFRSIVRIRTIFSARTIAGVQMRFWYGRRQFHFTTGIFFFAFLMTHRNRDTNCVCHLFDFNANVKIWNEKKNQRNGLHRKIKTVTNLVVWVIVPVVYLFSLVSSCCFDYCQCCCRLFNYHEWELNLFNISLQIKIEMSKFFDYPFMSVF